MPIEYLDRDDALAIANTGIRSQLPEIDPTVQGSWTRGITESFVSLFMTDQGSTQDVEKQEFPQSCDGDFLDNRWGAYEILPRNPATGARGYIAQEGVVGTIIPVDTVYTKNNIDYIVKSVATIIAQVGSISSLTRVGTIVTAVCAANHNFGNGQTVTMAGADQAEYNGSFPIIVTAADTFTYEITGTPVTPATGTIAWSSDFASVLVEASSTGTDTNLDSGATLSLVEPITGITEAAVVNFDSLLGGASVEDDESYRARIILSRSIIEGVFVNDQVELAALSITGNTRVFIKNPTITGAGGYLDPLPGQVSVFFLRDNDSNILPNPTLIAETKQAIIEQGKMPCHTATDDIFVQAPVLVTTDFDFTALTPDTPTMRIAVEENLKAFFEDNVDFEQSVTEASYLGAIQNTQDLTTGTFLISFTLSTPSGDIAVSAGELASLGNVTFSIT